MGNTSCNICTNTTNLNIFKIEGRGYASTFDGDKFSIELCECCVKKHGVKSEWFDNEFCQPNTLEDEMWATAYKHEEDVLNLIGKLSEAKREQIEDCESIFDEMINLYQSNKEAFLQVVGTID